MSSSTRIVKWITSPHVEADFDGWSEQIYVFEGRLTLVIEAQEHVLAAGDFYSFASNRMHAYRNDGDVATRFVRNVVI